MFVFIFLVRLKAGQADGAVLPPGRGEDGGAGALVALWNVHTFEGEPEPPVLLCPHSNC